MAGKHIIKPFTLQLQAEASHGASNVHFVLDMSHSASNSYLSAPAYLQSSALVPPGFKGEVVSPTTSTQKTHTNPHTTSVTKS